MTTKTSSKRVRRALIGVGAAVVVGALVLVSFRPKPVPVEVGKVERGRFQVTVNEDGKTRVKDRYVVSAPLGGQMSRVELRPGDDVEEGTVITHIVPVEPPLLDARTRAELEARVRAAEAVKRRAEAAVDQAETAHRYAKSEADRARQLAGERNIARQALDRAEMEERAAAQALESSVFGARVAAYELEVARANLVRSSSGGRGLDGRDVRAPVKGRVLRVLRESEGVVGAGTPLVELGDPAALEIVVDMLTTDAVQVSPGAPAIIDRWGGDETLSAHVRRVEPSATTKVSALGVEEQRVDVLLELDEPRTRWAALQDGYRVEARVVVYDRADAAFIAASALFRDRERWWVFAVEGDRAVLTPVTVGRTSGATTELEGGLGEGARVVLHPDDRVLDGTPIRALPTRTEPRESVDHRDAPVTVR